MDTGVLTSSTSIHWFVVVLVLILVGTGCAICCYFKKKRQKQEAIATEMSNIQGHVDYHEWGEHSHSNWKNDWLIYGKC